MDQCRIRRFFIQLVAKLPQIPQNADSLKLFADGSVKFDMKEYERNMTGQFELN